MGSLISKLMKVEDRRFGWTEVAEATEAAAALALAAIALRLLPFRTIVKMMNVEARGPRAIEASSATAAIQRAVRRASRRVPWRTVCFHEGLAAHWMLRRRGFRSQVHYGLRQGQGRLSAHVWVSLDDQIVIGHETVDPHLCVAVFPVN